MRHGPAAVPTRRAAQQGCDALADLHAEAADELVQQLVLTGVGGLTGWRKTAAAPRGEAESVMGIPPVSSFTWAGDNVRYTRTATAIGDDANTLQNLQRSKGTYGHDVIVHGSKEGECIVDGKITHPQQIADLVRENPYYHGGPIQLVTCHGACKAAGELSKALGGVEVRNASGHQVDIDPRTGRGRARPRSAPPALM
ncbi:hypothetical protein [Streptomyces sp. NPDC029674]|uniref:hypothetical protein n=1 Tax=Streptomyces sp. NPDC029674 TaxID=3365297 RepID=UPI00384A849B